VQRGGGVTHGLEAHDTGGRCAEGAFCHKAGAAHTGPMIDKRCDDALRKVFDGIRRKRPPGVQVSADADEIPAFCC